MEGRIKMRASCGFKGFVFLLVVLVCVLSRSGLGQPWDGNGVDGDPYLIYTAEEMQVMGAGFCVKQQFLYNSS
jgi:hypothetical protein